MSAALNMTDQRFGRLIAKQADGVLSGKVAWLCRCNCGTTVRVSGASLRRGLTQSCGCLRREKAALNGKATTREVVRYRMANQRVRIEKGSASDQPCVDCNEQAAEWSYDHADPHQLIDDVSGFPYSLDLDNYVPRCRPCHRQLDSLAKTG